jgi:hypothetical protein
MTQFSLFSPTIFEIPLFNTIAAARSVANHNIRNSPSSRNTMNNENLSGIPSDISVPRSNNRLGRKESDLTINTETDVHNPVKCSYDAANPARESIFLMAEEDDEREPPPKLTDSPPVSPTLIKPIRVSKEPVKQKRGRFLVWPAHQPLDFIST